MTSAELLAALGDSGVGARAAAALLLMVGPLVLVRIGVRALSRAL